MNFSIYGDDSNGLLRIDPRTKLLFFTGSMISFNCGAGLILSIYCCIVCGLLALCGKPWTALKGIFTFALAVYARYCIDIYDGGAPFIVTLLQEIIAIFLYGFPIIMAFTLLVQTTRIGNPDASDDDVLLASQKACCYGFVSELEQGFDTPVGALGGKLSGGQRQRIAFARAILKDAPIVVLDEAAAFVDSENESEMNKAIAEMTKSKTVIMIAHRLRSVENADKIIVLDNGVIEEQGTHSELMKSSRIYQNLVNSGNDDYHIERKRVSL